MNGSTRALRRLRARVLREEPLCWLQLPGCTRVSDTLDHIIPRADRPDLVLTRTNCRGACANCNRARGRLPVSVLPPRGRPKALDLFDQFAEIAACVFLSRSETDTSSVRVCTHGKRFIRSTNRRQRPNGYCQLAATLLLSAYSQAISQPTTTHLGRGQSWPSSR